MSNPIINKLDEYTRLGDDSQNVMTPAGTMTNFLIMSILLLIPAAITWNWAALHFMDRVYGMTWIGIIAGLILVLVMAFKPKTSPYLAPLYAVAEGMYVGGISAFFEMSFPGIVIQAVAATFAVTFVMYGLYKLKLISATEKFRSVVLIATGAIALLYLVNLGLLLFGVTGLSNMLWSNSLLGIGISVVICIVAALNLILDFDNIERYSQYNAPKYMEWFCATGLMITIVWLYLELLRLLAKLNRR